MTQNNPMEAVYKSVLSAYNPLHIKDILIHGASRKAIFHKSSKDIIEFYGQHNEGIHHELLDSKEKWFKLYAFMQYCYNQTDKTDQDQFEFLRDVVWLYIDKVADELGDDYELHNKDRQTIEDEVIALDLKFRKQQLKVIDGGKS
jgi:hypothetical protein